MSDTVTMRGALPAAVGLAAMILPAAAQSVVAAKAGLISYTEGQVWLDGRPVFRSRSHWPRMNDNQLLRSGAGRVEVMLNPCVVLHLDENSSLRLAANELTDTRVELLAGSAILQADAILKDTNVALLVKGEQVGLAHVGLFRFDAAPPRLRVFAGRAEVGPGRTLALDGSHASAKFDAAKTDDFYAWSEWRAGVLARSSGIYKLEMEQREEVASAAHRATNFPPQRLPFPVGMGPGRAHVCMSSGR